MTSTIDPVDQRRLAWMWWAGVVANLVAVAVAAAAAGWAAIDLSEWWAVGAEGVLLAGAAAVAVWTRPRPFSSPTRRVHSDRDREAARKRLLRGEPVDPPTLRVEGLDAARRNLWSVGMQGLMALVLAFSCVVRRDSPHGGIVLAVFGTLWLMGGVAALTYLGSRRRRLDAHEDAPDVAGRPSHVGGATS